MLDGAEVGISVGVVVGALGDERGEIVPVPSVPMTRRTAVSVLCGLLVSLVGLLSSPTAAGAQTPASTITVTPSTGLVHQQSLEVTGSGSPRPSSREC